jgi:hypothetical protein
MEALAPMCAHAHMYSKYRTFEYSQGQLYAVTGVLMPRKQ